jgi:hypothetical protein
MNSSREGPALHVSAGLIAEAREAGRALSTCGSALEHWLDFVKTAAMAFCDLRPVASFCQFRQALRWLRFAKTRTQPGFGFVLTKCGEDLGSPGK